MRREIINLPVLQCVVASALLDRPAALAGRDRNLRRTLMEITENHSSVRPARKRKSDPDWALVKFARHERLFRFDQREEAELREELGDVMRELAQIAELALGRGRAALQAKTFLNALPHHRPGSMEIGQALRELQDTQQTEQLMNRRHEVLREAAEHHALGLVGRRCRSVSEIIGLGREARNCLKDAGRYAQDFVAGRSDFWAVRDGARLAAILECRRSGFLVAQAQAPGNEDIASSDLRGVVAFCKAAGLRIDVEACPDLISEFAEDPLVGPIVVQTKAGLAVYSEWPGAVWIDLEAPRRRHGRPLRHNETRRFVQKIPLDQPVAVAIVEGSELRLMVKLFGKKILRKVVAQVALAQAVPTLVQHRLLALAA